ncbi:MAG: glycosyl hydrolase [Ignavibacteria bacterium]|nr:glycosyl hydrolase [Ignavibacteria bacterium]
MRRFSILAALLCMLLPFTSRAGGEDEKTKKKDDPMSQGTFAGLKFRGIGPALASGRISDIAVHPQNKSLWYVAVACGGVWKTTNSGTSWEPVFDGQTSFSIGCVTIDPNNPHTVWVGTGENNSQRSVSYGDGVYRSDDGGKSWKCMGLKKSEHIGKILVHPKHSNIVYVAAQGPLWAAGGERGLYKTTDGGKTWNAVLSISEHTGVTDIAMDPRNPDLIYAASYQRRRHVWTLINGGPEANIYRTTDGGASWDTLRSGLPSVDKGRIGLAVSPVDPDIVYATIEAAEGKGGFFRSSDRGSTWEKRNDFVSDAAQYYQELVCDPKDADRVFILHTILMVSDDGGRNFRALGNRHRHVDDHAMWIDPANTDYYLVGGDGGVYESWDRGAMWRFKENLPVTQYYRVSTDNAEPFYNVYGGTQDNNSMGGPSRTTKQDGAMNEDWFFTNGGDGFESQIDPTDPNIVYAQSQYGGLVRFDKKSGERQDIQPLPPPGEAPYRWNWDSPLLISPHKHTRLYFACNRLFRSDDRGDSWKAVSPDLSRQIDRNTLPVMGKVWGPEAVAKNASTSYYGNIVAFAESPKKEGLLYAGTDDGLVQVSENGGETWRKIESFPGVPDRSYVSCIVASQHAQGTLYASFDNHKMADFKPYLLKSADNGASWTSIAATLPENGAVYSIAEDHVNPKLLFAGTEFGVFFSIDGGGKWMQLKGGLPPIAIRDIDIQKRENDLVLASFGRGFYILDDYTPLRDATSELLAKDAHIFPVKDALMYVPSTGRSKGAQGETFYTAPNPPFGATFSYYVKESVKTKKEVRRDAEKEAIKKKETPPYPTFEQLRIEDEEEAPSLLFTVKDAEGNVLRRLSAPNAKGVQRVTWDLRYPDLTPVRDQKLANKGSGMVAMPGTYTVTLSRVADEKETVLAGPVTFTAKILANSTLPASDRAALVAFQKKAVDLQRRVMGLDRALTETKTRLGYIKGALEVAPAATAEMRAAREAMDKALSVLQRRMSGDRSLSARNENQPPSIMNRLYDMVYSQWSSTSAPTKSNLDTYEHVAKLAGEVVTELRVITDTQLPALEKQLDAIGAPWTPGRVLDVGR